MNHCILIPLSLLFYSAVPAQPKTPRTSLSRLSTATIQLNNPNAQPGPSNGLFRHFEVIDQRPDTTRIGIHYSPVRLGKPHNLQLVFPKPAAQTLSGYLDKCFAHPDGSWSILVVLRNLWLSDAKYLREDMAKDPDKVYERSHLRVRMEIYATRDSLFLPLYRLDTLVITRHLSTYGLTTSYSTWDKNLAAVLNEMADSAAILMQRKQGRSRLVSREDISRYNQSRFTNPVDDQSLKAGVYASFEEFRNNTPSVQDFEIQMQKNKRLLYIKEGGAAYYSHDAWGYCDGKNIYIMREGSLCQAWREGKAWYLFGEADLEAPSNYYGPTLLSEKPTVAGTRSATTPVALPFGADLAGVNRTEIKRVRIYTLDPDNGDIY